ncbi:MAG: 1-acyl-sn-glycerol-3-phosphate acyltransferase [Clostridia bacterium]|nr:1-acyl-sn-glycerol-3-phosphate acyltransferase [Clostridia bacterium]
MTIKTKVLPYEQVMALPKPKHKKPLRQNPVLKLLIKALSMPAMYKSGFTVNRINMDKLGKKEPCLILMNHTSFFDMKVAAHVLFPRTFGIVTTTDGFVGLNPLMRLLGCIPTNKFVFDPILIKDIMYSIRELKSSVLMYPEAGYTFDGTATPLPDSIGKFVKMLGAPVVMIKTYGVFQRDPLYNNLQLRKSKTSADVEYLLSPQQIQESSAEEIQSIINSRFDFDGFRYQQENKISVPEPFRADCLHRVLYKCPHCMAECATEGKGISLVCHSCGKSYTLDQYGYLVADDGDAKFNHVPDWYRWQRECVKKELEDGKYRLQCDVDIYMLVNTKCVYKVGDGTLTHTSDGFHLVGCDGKLDHLQKPETTYNLNADFYWYEKGDVIGFGDRSVFYYCIPKDQRVSVAKARLATEVLYQMKKQAKRRITE